MIVSSLAGEGEPVFFIAGTVFNSGQKLPLSV